MKPRNPEDGLMPCRAAVSHEVRECGDSEFGARHRNQVDIQRLVISGAI